MSSDMKGKRVVITGPTSGVGRETALQLAELGAEVILACRDLQKGGQLSGEIESRTGQKAVVMMIDTSSQESIRECAQEFREEYDRLDVLINNAAVSRGKLPRIRSVDGIELTFATNVLGYFLLTQELLDLIKKSAPADELLVQAAKEGMTTLKQDGIVKVFKGMTDISEVRRVCVT